MTKKIIAVVLLILLGLGAWFGYQYFYQKGIKRSVLSVLPEDAVYILKTDNLTDAWQEISRTNIWHHLIKTKDFEYLQAIDTLLNKSLLDNQTANIILEDRPVAMTAYMVSQKDYDFVYTVDLQQAKIVKKVLKQLLKTLSGYKVKTLKYEKQSVYKLTDLKKPNTKIFIAAMDNILMVSFNYSLLQKIIDERYQTHWLQQPAFTKINDKLNGGLIQFFFNYKQLPAFVNLYFENAQPKTSNIAHQLLLSGFDIHHDDERIIMDGWTLTDSVPSYYNALLDIKPGRWSFDQVMSDQAAIVTSVGFKNFNIFYQSLSDQYFGDDVQKKNAYRKQIKKLENYLSINLQQNLFDWIGQEISLAKIKSYKPNRPQDLVLLIQTEDIEAAQKGMDFISEQIRKKSPFKFKSYTYKNFPINYLHQKDFFKIILGNWLKDIDKPYYTFMDDYVVFSNSEVVLKHFIEDYITGKTLSHNEDFLDFKADLQNKSNMFVYIQMPKLYHILKQNFKPESRKSLNENKALILSFSRIGLQLITKDDLFKTLAVIDHDEKALEKEQADQLAHETDESIHNNFFEDLEFKIAFPDSLQYGNGLYHKYYKDGQTLALEGKIQDNLPIGIWRSYYPSGNLQSVINYDNGEVNGEIFYYYDKPDKLMVQTNYDHDLLSGDYFEYWPNGAIKAKLHFKDGKLNGDAIFYYKTGQVKIEGKYRNGEKKSKWLFYDQKGNVTHKKRYSGFIF